MIPGLETGWLWGLVGDDAAAALWSYEAQMAGMLAVEAALTRALPAAGLCDPNTAETVARSIESTAIDADALRNAAARDGVPVAELVARLRAAADPAHRELIHRGATSQDILDTVLVLTLRRQTDDLLMRTEAVSGLLDRLAAEQGDRAIMGRTRMQAAQAITVSDRLTAWRSGLLDASSTLTALRPRVERLQLGGAVGTRAELGPDPEAVATAMARLLELGPPPRPWHTARGPLAAQAGAFSELTGALGKMGQDIALMAQQGIDEIALAAGGGSSAMPHKRNPVLAELLVTLARFNAVQVSGMHHALIHEQERSGAAWTLEWLILPQMANATARALAVAETLLRSVERIGAA